MATAPATPAASATPINWSAVLNQVIAAVGNVLGQKWQSVSQTATYELESLTATAKWIHENKDKLDVESYNILVDAHKNTLHDILVGSELINKALADQAVNAAWTVILAALKTASKFPF